MSAPSPGQLRPNSAIYIGLAAEQEGILSTTTPLLHHTSNEQPLRSPNSFSRQTTPHLPSPPHTSSTSGSAGEHEQNSTRTKRAATIGLPTVTVMQNGGEDDDFDEIIRQADDGHSRFSLAEKNRELLDKLERFGPLNKGRVPSTGMSPASRTISLGRASSATAAAAISATSSMRHVSLNYPPRKSQERDVFDREESKNRSHSASNSLSVPRSITDMDDRSATPPVTPGKRLLELSNNTSPGRQRLASEPTSPRRLQMLRERTPGKGSEGTVNLSSPLRESVALSSPMSRNSPLSNTAGRSSTMNSPGNSSLRRTTTLGTVDEGNDKKSPATRKARTPIPFEFLASGESELHPPDADRTRQPSPGLYTSEGALSSPGLYVSESTDSLQTRERSSGSIRASRRPRPPGARNSIDRSYEQWEREQTGDAGNVGDEDMDNTVLTPRQTEIVPETPSTRRAGSAVGSSVRSVVNEGLRAAGLTRERKVSDSGAVVASPTALQTRERESSLEVVHSGSAARVSSDRSRSRTSERELVDMDSLRERATRNTFFSPNVRGNRTIHNVLNPSAGDSTSPTEEPNGAIVNGRETPANLRLFKQNYAGSTPILKSYTSPSGTQRHLPSRSVTALNLTSHGSEYHGGSVSNSRSSVPGTPSPTKRSIPLGGSNQSSPSTVNGAGPVNLLQDALWMFESHVHKLPPSSVPEVTNDVLRDARVIVNAAVALNGALRGAAGVCVDEQIEAEVSKEGNDAALGAADVWRRVGAEFREDARVSDELVRALTSFMIGAGRMLRSSSSGHGRMSSINGGDGSVSRAGGSALARGSSISRAGGSSDGRRSVEGWSLGIGMSGAERRSMDGRRSIEPGSRRSADDYREESMRRLTSRQSNSRDPGEAGSNGSGGSKGQRISFQGFTTDSRPGTSLSSRRELPRIAQEESLSSPGPRTFTSLSSRRSTGAPTPAMSQKSLPRLPMPTSAGSGDLSFPQSEDGGDRTPIELPRPHMRHSTMPPLAILPPLPTLPSESLLQRGKTIGKHAASNSITSASTSSTTRPNLLGPSATVRGSAIIPVSGSGMATTAVTPTTARPRQTSFSAGVDNPTTSPFSLGRARGSAAVNGLQQFFTKDSPKMRTISNADAEYLEEDLGTARLHSNQSSTASSSTIARSSSGSQVGFPSGSSRDSPGGGLPTTFEPRRSGVRPTANRRSSSNISGASNHTITSSVANPPPVSGRPRAVTRISSAGTLSNPNYGSRSSLTSPTSGGNSTESGTDLDKRLRRTNKRLSLTGIMDRRGGIGDLLSARRLGGRHMLEGEEHDVGDSPSLSARERRERRRIAEEV